MYSDTESLRRALYIPCHRDNCVTVWLIVEDDNTTIQIFKTMTVMHGHERIGFLDGQAALPWIDVLDQGQIPAPLPTITHLDIRLPKITRIAIAEHLRKSRVFRGIDVIFKTAGYVSKVEKQEILTKTGAKLLLRKPLPNLVQALQMLNSSNNKS
jgi:CheY-like chemotaxis protein